MATRRSTPTLVPATRLAAVRSTSGLDEPARLSAERAIDHFVDLLGGRDALVETLEVGTQQVDIDRVLDLLNDPRYDGWSLAKVCTLAGLSVADLFQAFRSATLLRAQIAATAQIAAGIAPVVADLLARAAPYSQVCDACEGVGSRTPNPSKANPNPQPEPCRACRATGQVTIYPELERQKVVLELADLLKRGGGGITLTQQSMVVQAGQGGSRTGDLERLQQVMGGILTGQAPTLPRSLSSADLPQTFPTADTVGEASPRPDASPSTPREVAGA